MPDGAGNVGKCSVPIVRVENVTLVSAPGAVGTNQFVDRVPSLLIIVRRLGFERANWPPPAARKSCSDLRAIGPETMPFAM